MNALQTFAVETERLQGISANIFTKKSEHRLLAVVGRNDRHAKRNHLFFYFRFETPVLRKPFFVKLEIREHLDPRNDALRRRFRKLHCVVQDAVNAITNQHRIFARFYVDVRGILYERVFQERLNYLHHRQIIRELF